MKYTRATVLLALATMGWLAAPTIARADRLLVDASGSSADYVKEAGAAWRKRGCVADQSCVD